MGSEATQFQPGNKAAVGRRSAPRSGRKLALARLDKVMAEAGVLDVLEEQLREMAMSNPVAFFTKIVAPLLPKEATIELETNGELRLVFPPMNDPTQTLMSGSSDTTPMSGNTACIEAPPDSE